MTDHIWCLVRHARLTLPEYHMIRAENTAIIERRTHNYGRCYVFQCLPTAMIASMLGNYDNINNNENTNVGTNTINDNDTDRYKKKWQ